MMNKEEYIKAVIAMWDSMRNDFFKGRDDCIGVRCSECPLSDTDAYCCDCCNKAKYIFDVYNIIEKWHKEHQPKKLTRLEFEMLKWLDKGDYKFIVRNPGGNLMIYYDTPEKDVSFWISENGYKTLTSFNELFKFIQWEDKEPTSIQDILKNCEVKEDV